MAQSYSFAGSTSSDELEIPTSTGTQVSVATSASASISAAIVSQSSTGNLQTTGPGTLTIATGATAYVNNLIVGSTNDTGTLEVDGTLNIAAGCTLSVTNGTVLTGADTGTINLPTGASLQYNSSATSTFDGTIAASTNGTLINYGPGTLILAGTGTVTVNTMKDLGGTLEIDDTTTITNQDDSGNGFLVDDPAVLQGTGTIMLDSGTTTVAPLAYNSDQLSSFSGTITGPGDVEIDGGTGTLTLTGTNNYGGGTFLAAGTLSINSDAAFGATSSEPNITFDADATLQAVGTVALSAAQGDLDKPGRDRDL